MNNSHTFWKFPVSHYCGKKSKQTRRGPTMRQTWCEYLRRCAFYNQNLRLETGEEAYAVYGVWKRERVGQQVLLQLPLSTAHLSVSLVGVGSIGTLPRGDVRPDTSTQEIATGNVSFVAPRESPRLFIPASNPSVLFSTNRSQR